MMFFFPAARGRGLRYGLFQHRVKNRVRHRCLHSAPRRLYGN